MAAIRSRLGSRVLMNLEYELLREFDRVVSPSDQAANMPINLNISENTGHSRGQVSMMLSATGGLAEAVASIASSEVKNETPEVMNVALAEQNGIMPLSYSPEEVMAPLPVNWKLDNCIPQFLSKVYEIVDDPMTDHVVHWGFEGKSFFVQDVGIFCNLILAKYFKHGNFSSFIRQLNTYGFRKIDCDKWEFAMHEFQRGKIHQLKYIKRRSSGNKKMGVGSGKHDEAFQKYLKNLSSQIANLSQQVEVCSSNFSAFEKRMQAIERKNMQFACLLSKVIQDSGFMAELLKRTASVESKHDDGETEVPSDQTMAETYGTPKLSSDSTHLLSNCNVTAHVQPPNKTEMQISDYPSAPSFGESSHSPNNPQGSEAEMVVDGTLESLDNELIIEMEPGEEMELEKCMSYFHELASSVGVDESNHEWVAYLANQPIDKKS